MSIRWLHISDIHECDRDRFFREAMYRNIVEEVRKHPHPDLVFLTGDMANWGLASEYESLEKAFIAPLRDALPSNCPIFTVPGNHDVYRKGAADPRGWFQTSATDAKLFQLPDEDGAKFRNERLFPHFEPYTAFERRVSVWGGSDWLKSQFGSICWSGTFGGNKVAVVGVNTAWLCQDDDDAGKLTPGRFLLEAGLREAAKTGPDLLIVLGHHPLDTLIARSDDADGRRVRLLLQRHNAVYLHGDLHSGASQRLGDAENNTLAIQAPAAFQAVDDRRWRNGLMWAEAEPKTGYVMVEPKVWNDDHDEFKFNFDAGEDKKPQ